MGKAYYFDVATKVLDVHWGKVEPHSEIFEIDGKDYYFTDCGIYHAENGWSAEVELIHDLLYGACFIKRKPWKPKMGEEYWLMRADGFSMRKVWTDDVLDLAFFAIGNCFQTKEQALRDGPGVIAEQLKKYEEA